MGWWDEGILGGDEPLDAVLGIEKIVFGKYGEDREITKGHLERRCRKLLDYAKQCPVNAQVVGYLHMKTGAMMSDELRRTVIGGCLRDEWANEKGSTGSQKRQQIMIGLALAALDYMHEPVEVEKLGGKDLFQVISQQIGWMANRIRS
jgi:hypothetical protein